MLAFAQVWVKKIIIVRSSMYHTDHNSTASAVETSMIPALEISNPFTCGVGIQKIAPGGIGTWDLTRASQ